MATPGKLGIGTMPRTLGSRVNSREGRKKINPKALAEADNLDAAFWVSGQQSAPGAGPGKRVTGAGSAWKKERFTSLFHHVSIALLRQSFLALNPRGSIMGTGRSRASYPNSRRGAFRLG
jgi:hypothetical protein